MKIHKFLNNPKKWTHGSLARDHRGYGTLPIGRYAKSWCLAGIMIKCYGGSSDKYNEVKNKLQQELGRSMSITLWNDDPNRTFQDVKNLVTRLDI